MLRRRPISSAEHAGQVGVIRVSAERTYIATAEEKMTRITLLSMCLAASWCLAASCLAASSPSLNARGQDARTQDVPQYTDGPVTDVQYIHVEYGHFETYIDWLNSTWKPTMEAAKKAGLIID